MPAKSPRPKSANRTGGQGIHRQAAEWFAVLHDENVSEDDRKRWG
jgi:ferric-dicitrate binding protein FerR (iron transport regulator)